MSEPTASVDATSTALVVHSHANLPPDLSVAFDLRRLPFELRAKVFGQAALAGSEIERWLLSTVNRELRHVTAPHVWECLFIDDNSPVERLQFLTETILPRYGEHVKTLKLYTDDPGSVPTYLACKMVEEALMKMPNIQLLMMRSGSSAYQVVCLSPHLASLTTLNISVDRLDSNVVHHLATMISCAVNLVSLIIAVKVATGEVGPLPAAIASHRNLTVLSLNDPAILDAAATADWQSSLTALHCHNLRDTAMTPPAFRTFVSRFSNTLGHLQIVDPPSSWSNHPTPIIPLPLPHLRVAHICLRRDDLESSFLLLPSLIADSPIERAFLYRPTLEDGWNDGTSTYDMAIELMEAHKKTLRFLELSSPPGRGEAERLALEDLEMYARMSGVELKSIVRPEEEEEEEEEE